MRELKIYRGNWNGTVDRAVVCRTKKKAQELLGARSDHMNNNFTEGHTHVRNMDQVVWASPEVVFERRMDDGMNAPDVWTPVANSNNKKSSAPAAATIKDHDAR